MVDLTHTHYSTWASIRVTLEKAKRPLGQTRERRGKRCRVTSLYTVKRREGEWGGVEWWT